MTLLVEVSKPPEDFQLLWQSPTEFRGAEIQCWTWPTGFVCSLCSTALQHGHAGLIFWVSWSEKYLTEGPSCACSPEAYLMCTRRGGVWLHLSLTARPDPGHTQEGMVLGVHLMSHCLHLQSVHALLPGPLPLRRWLCPGVNYMPLDQILHTALISSRDCVWLSTLRCWTLDNLDIFWTECHLFHIKRNLFHVAAESPIFNITSFLKCPVFFLTNCKLNFSLQFSWVHI